MMLMTNNPSDEITAAPTLRSELQAIIDAPGAVTKERLVKLLKAHPEPANDLRYVAATVERVEVQGERARAFLTVAKSHRLDSGTLSPSTPLLTTAAGQEVEAKLMASIGDNVIVGVRHEAFGPLRKLIVRDVLATDTSSTGKP